MNDTTLPIADKSLRSRLDMIMYEIPYFWEQRSYRHFTNHGPAHSERVFRKIAQLAQELPADRRLSDDEVFIISAAAWLYEIGMQSPNLYEDYGFNPVQDPNILLSFEQLQRIRENKHLLSYRLIVDSVRGSDYKGPLLRLGLARPADNYVRAIAEVCKGCSSEPLDTILSTMPVSGSMVRIRLLVALLRLADQLYIENLRVNLDRLEEASLPLLTQARWWMYHYAQTLPIDRGNIRFHYLLPSVHKSVLGHIRTLIEPGFTYVNNPVIRYLREEWDMRLMVHPQPEVILETPPGFQLQMSSAMLQFIKQEVVVEPDMIEPPAAGSAPREEEEGPLLVVDYENFLLQLGREGYFLTPGEINSLMIALLKETKNLYHMQVKGLLAGHWNRADLASNAVPLGRLYDLLTVDTKQSVAEALQQELVARVQSPDAPAQTLLVAPHRDMAEVIRRFRERKLSVNAWIGDGRDAEEYTALLFEPKLFSETLKTHLPPAQRLTSEELFLAQVACILRIDEELDTQQHAGIALAELPALLNRVPLLKGHGEWWRLQLLDQRVIAPVDPGRSLVKLNPDHPQVSNIRALRGALIQVLGSLARSGKEEQRERGATVQQIERNLRSMALFSDDSRPIEQFLLLLQQENIVQRTNRTQPAPGAVWSVNAAHWRVIAASADHSLPLLILGIDHFLVAKGFDCIHEHALARQLVGYVEPEITRTLYTMARERGWLQTTTVADRHSPQKTLVEVRLVIHHREVQQILLNRNLLLEVLQRNATAEGMKREWVWNELRQTRSTLTRETMNSWLSIFQASFQQELLLQTLPDSTHNAVDERLRLNPDSLLCRRLLGRLNIFGVVQTMRISGANHTPERAQPLGEIAERLARHVTFGQRGLATLALQYARSIGLIVVLPGTTPEGAKQERAFLKGHPFISELNQRDTLVCRALAELVRELIATRYPDGRVPLLELRRAMENDKEGTYGLTRQEQNYWLNQVEHEKRHRLVQRQKDFRTNSMYVTLVKQEVH
jgi:hypothetical protein